MRKPAQPSSASAQSLDGSDVPSYTGTSTFRLVEHRHLPGPSVALGHLNRPKKTRGRTDYAIQSSFFSSVNAVRGRVCQNKPAIGNAKQVDGERGSEDLLTGLRRDGNKFVVALPSGILSHLAGALADGNWYFAEAGSCQIPISHFLGVLLPSL